MASQREINAKADQILSQHDSELSQGGHAQAVRPASHDLSSQESDQQSYLSKTGESLKNAAAGAVNLAQGAAASVKNTLGVNSESNNPSANNAAADAAANHPGGNNAAAAGANHPGGNNAAAAAAGAAAANHPSSGNNAAAAAAGAAAANHPSSGNNAAAAAAGAAAANHPSNPSNRF